MGKLELEQQVGRLIIGRLPACDLPDVYAGLLSDGIVGGVTLFKNNASSLEQLAELVGEIIGASFHNPVICVDQEGGAVQRFDHVLTPLPSPMALAASDDEELIDKVTRLNARQLKMLGINCLLAPTLDVITNPLNPVICTRAFSDRPSMVVKFGRVVIDAIVDEGMVAVGKHFPGHGSTIEDSHHALAVNHFAVEKIWTTDLAPFKGTLDILPAVLTGHIWLQAVDEEPTPASLSSRVTQSILRDYLGFDGLVMTDDMTMKGLTSCHSIGEAAVRAVEAGADLLLACSGVDDIREIHQCLLEAVTSGRLSEKRIAESLRRVRKAFPRIPKSSSPAKHPRKFSRLKKIVSEGAATSLSASQKGVALMRGRIPDLSKDEWVVMTPDHERYNLNLSDYINNMAQGSCGDTGSGASRFEVIRYPLEPEYETTLELAEKCKNKNVIFLTFRCLIFEEQLRLGQQIADRCAGKVAVCTDTPYDVSGLPDWPTVLATHDPSDQAMRALAQVLLSGTATGLSPVQANAVPV